MSSEEIEQKEEEKLPREEIPVPLYFDRYVVSEIHALGNQITQVDRLLGDRITQVDRRIDDLKESMEGRFTQIEGRFTQVDRRIDDLKESMEERFTQVDRRIDELKESVDKLFDKSDATIKWVIGLFSPFIVGILAIIVKMFFGP
jgi:DNA-binding transcriptional MerR regulator